MHSGTKTPEAIAEDVGAMMSRIWLMEDADGHLENDCEVAFHIKEIGGTMIRCFGPWLKAKLENLWCLDNIDELDVAFSDSSRPLFNEKDKDVEVNSRRNHLLDDSTRQNNPINIEHNGGSCANEGAKKGGKGQVQKGKQLMPDLITGALHTLGVDTMLEVLSSQEFDSIKGENRKRVAWAMANGRG
ncbi:hypothetical protein SLEP1_g10749 [Rubroshorea leprosula]|uniref:Uncharacterized protein n=1 Tax=Rubroshorea leprosula TaxID=152421 RepID=A0AAV5I915_9ROSI|nr:hypothetical protein SLEP1_g10749 [Rubroshorea leprosula]